MTMWCPTCRSEYRDGIGRCADCGAELVGELPPLPPRATRPAITGPFSPDDDIVELTTTTAAEAEVTAAYLRSNGIAATVFGVDPYSGYGAALQNAQGARIMVRREDVHRAARFVRAPDDEPPRPRPMWVRGIALIVLLLVAVPIAAADPQVLVAIAAVTLVAVLVRQLRRPAGDARRRAQRQKVQHPSS